MGSPSTVKRSRLTQPRLPARDVAAAETVAAAASVEVAAAAVATVVTAMVDTVVDAVDTAEAVAAVITRAAVVAAATGGTRMVETLSKGVMTGVMIRRHQYEEKMKLQELSPQKVISKPAYAS